MALPSNYRFVAVNSTGAQIDAGLVTVDIEPFSGDGSGNVSQAAEQTGSNSSSISAGASQAVLTVSGSTAIGLNGTVDVALSTNGTTPNGDVEVFIERSTDGGTTYSRDPSPVYTENFTSKRDDDEAIAA
jgi:hypothetical protein